MTKLTSSSRKKLPSKDFGLSKERKYPVEDKVHTRIAKSYASKEFNAGKLSASSKKKIDSKANSKLKGK